MSTRLVVQSASATCNTSSVSGTCDTCSVSGTYDSCDVQLYMIVLYNVVFNCTVLYSSSSFKNGELYSVVLYCVEYSVVSSIYLT